MLKNLLSKIKYHLKITDPKKVKIHPIYNKVIEYSFTCDGIHYYKLVSPSDIYQDRASFMIQFSTEMDMRLTSDMLNEYMDQIIAATVIKDNQIDLGAIQTIAHEINYRQEWLFEPDSLMRMASVIFFDLKEDIRTFDWQYNTDKMDTWKKKEKVLPFLIGQLIDGHNPFLNLSKNDSHLYLRKQKEVIERQQAYLAKAKASMPKSKKESKTSGSENG